MHGLNERLSNLNNTQIRSIGNELVQDIVIMSGYIYNLVKTIQWLQVSCIEPIKVTSEYKYTIWVTVQQPTNVGLQM